MKKYLIPIFTVTLSTIFWFVAKASADSQQTINVESVLSQLKDYSSLDKSKVMVLGTYHFNKAILEPDQQQSIKAFIELLKNYKPTKILLEWEPKYANKTNKDYRDFLNNKFSISTHENEVYQIGFRLAKELKHTQLYFIDDQTDYIGTLDNFSFDAFTKYAKENDDGFFNRYEETMSKTFQHNQKLLTNLLPSERITILNSDKNQEINSNRMHMYEVRVGIQKSWIGPDWLGRWYQRNVRMLANSIKLAEKNDRLLIIVGDNHKWILDTMIERTPNLESVSSWDFLKNETHQ